MQAFLSRVLDDLRLARRSFEQAPALWLAVIAACFALTAAATAYLTGSVWIGLLAGIVASLVFALIHGVASITFRGNQLISGVAINFLASGLTVLISSAMATASGMRWLRCIAAYRWLSTTASSRSSPAVRAMASASSPSASMRASS